MRWNVESKSETTHITLLYKLFTFRTNTFQSKLTLFFVSFQIASTVAFIWYHLWWTGGGEFRGDGMFNNNPVHDVGVRSVIDSVLRLEDEQRIRIHNVSTLHCFRYSLTYVRIRLHRMSRIISFLSPRLLSKNYRNFI